MCRTTESAGFFFGFFLFSVLTGCKFFGRLEPAWQFSQNLLEDHLESPPGTGLHPEAANSAHELKRWPHGENERPRMPSWNHPLKVSLGCARRPRREPSQTGPFGGDGYALRYKNSTHRFPFFRGGVLPRVHRGHRHCFRQLLMNFRAARTPDAQAVPHPAESRRCRSPAHRPNSLSHVSTLWPSSMLTVITDFRFFIYFAPGRQ